MSLITVATISSPPTTATTNGTIHRPPVRYSSTAASTTASPITTEIDPSWVTAFSTWVESGEAWRFPHFATLLSIEARRAFVRTR